MTPRTSLITLALTATAGFAGWSFAQQPKQTTTQPAATTAPPYQYALLSHYELSTFLPYEGGNWRFEEPGVTHDAASLAKNFGFKPGNEQFPAFIVNTIASRGWELISHTDVATTTPADVNNGSSMGSSSTRRIEQWWFKKR